MGRFEIPQRSTSGRLLVRECLATGVGKESVAGATSTGTTEASCGGSGMAATGAASCGVTATGSSRWPMATAAIAGRSFTARTGRDLRILSEAQSSPASIAIIAPL
jgi:hypothetical protein